MNGKSLKRKMQSANYFQLLNSAPPEAPAPPPLDPRKFAELLERVKKLEAPRGATPAVLVRLHSKANSPFPFPIIPLATGCSVLNTATRIEDGRGAPG